MESLERKRIVYDFINAVDEVYADMPHSVREDTLSVSDRVGFTVSLPVSIVITEGTTRADMVAALRRVRFCLQEAT